MLTRASARDVYRQALPVIVVSLVAGLFAGTVLGSETSLTLPVVALSLTAVSLSDRLGYNPDDTTIPIVTNVSDVSGVLILFAVISVVL